jgi:tetratricopeptide (TPR) repeat protein
LANINPVKLRQDAEKAERAGKFEPAIAAYTRLAEENRADWSITNKIGDLHARLGNTKEASVCWSRVAEHLAAEGFHLKAIAIWKKINKIDAAALEPYQHLAALYVKQGLLVDARNNYMHVIEDRIQKKRMKEAVEVLRKLVAINPVDLDVRNRLVKLLRSEGRPEEAVDEALALGQDLRSRGRAAEAAEVIERALTDEPQSPRLRLLLGQTRMDLGEAPAAGKIFDEVAGSSSGDAEILKGLADGYMRLERFAEAEDALRKLLLLQPDDFDNRAQLARVVAAAGRADDACAEALPVVEHLVEQRTGGLAAALLEHLAARSKSHVATLERLVEVYRQTHREAELTSACDRLAHAYEAAGENVKAIEVLDTLVGREPAMAEFRERLTRLRRAAGHGGASTGRLTPATGAIVLPEARPAIRQSRGLSDADKEFLEEHLAESRVFRKYGLLEKAIGQLQEIVSRFPDNAAARVELRDIYAQQGDRDRAADQSLALAEISRLSGDSAAAAAHEAEGRALPLPGAIAVAVGEVVLGEPPVLEVDPPAIAVDVDQPFSFGDADSALASLVTPPPLALPGTVADSPVSVHDLEDLEIEYSAALLEPAVVEAPMARPTPPPAPPAAAPLPLTVEDDMSQVFRGRAAAPEIGDAGLAEMFREFRKGVDEQLGSEDHDTRYNLGIAYKEMGLLDEAIGEFKLAAEDPQRALECMSMIGLCFMEKGSPAEAARWFENGLAQKGRTPEEYRGLEYDLAVAYEASGEKPKAFEQFSRLAAKGAFRDVAARLRKLKAEVS